MSRFTGKVIEVSSINGNFTFWERATTPRPDRISLSIEMFEDFGETTWRAVVCDELEEEDAIWISVNGYDDGWNAFFRKCRGLGGRAIVDETSIFWNPLQSKVKRQSHNLMYEVKTKGISLDAAMPVRIVSD